MFKPAALFIGLRYLRSVRREGVLSFYSWVSILGLVLGVATLITVLSVLNGFEQAFEHRVLGLVAPIKVLNPDNASNGKNLAAQLQHYPGIKAVAPFSELSALAVSADHTQTVYLWAVDPASEKKFNQLTQYVNPLQWQQFSHVPQGILLGHTLADQLQVKKGDDLSLLLAQPNAIAEGHWLPMNQTVTVVGIINTETELDKYLALVTLSTAQPWLQRAGPQGFKLLIDQVMLAPYVAEDLTRYLHGEYPVMDWTQSYGNLYHAIKMPRTVMGFLLLLILLVAAFNVTTSLVMTVKQKNKQIAVLRTYGVSTAHILGVFLVQGAVIGCLGIGLGASLGCLLAWYLPDMIVWVERIAHVTLFQGSSYFISYLPSVLIAQDVIKVSGIAFILCLLAACYPAWRAASLHPVEVFRQNS